MYKFCTHVHSENPKMHYIRNAYDSKVGALQNEELQRALFMFHFAGKVENLAVI